MHIPVRLDFDRGAWQETISHLEKFAAGELRQSVADAIREVTSELPNEIKAYTRTRLPRRGGLAERVAGTNIVRHASVIPEGITVRITAEPNAISEPERLNRGRLRHPVFGHWLRNIPTQTVRPGWFTDPIAKAEPDLHNAIVRAINEEISKI